jgi:alpha-galactosidase
MLLEQRSRRTGDSPFDVANQINVIPEHASARIGRPGVEGSRGGGRDWSASFRTTSQRLEDLPGGGQRFVAEAADPLAGLEIAVEIELTSVGRLRLAATLTNTAEEPSTPGALRLALPVAPQTEELLDFTGRHSKERVPQCRAFSVGLHSREVRTGRTGLDSAHVLGAGRAGFGFRTGEVWGVHLAWSGNQVVYGQRLYNGARLLGGGELLHGEIILGQGESYASPWLYGNYGHGLDDIASRFHRYLRSRLNHPTRPRPVILNTWEAVYFGQDLETLKALAERGAAVDVERFVLDDGWFSERRDDTSSLGDWTVSPYVWPEGFGPADRLSTRSACSSGSGWSRRWSTSTQMSPAPTLSGSSALAVGQAWRLATSMCSTSATRARMRTSMRALTRCSTSTTSPISSGTTTDTSTTQGTRHMVKQASMIIPSRPTA